MGQLIVGRKFTVFALFYFVYEGNFQVKAPAGAYIRRGDLMAGFLRYKSRGLIFRGACTWRGLFSEFYRIITTLALLLRVGDMSFKEQFYLGFFSDTHSLKAIHFPE